MDDSTQLLREDLSKIDSKLLRLCNTVDAIDPRLSAIDPKLSAIEKQVKSMAQWIGFIGFATLVFLGFSVCGAVYVLFLQ